MDPDIGVVADDGRNGFEVVDGTGVGRADADGQVVWVQAFGDQCFYLLAEVVAIECVGVLMSGHNLTHPGPSDGGRLLR